MRRRFNEVRARTDSLSSLELLPLALLFEDDELDLPEDSLPFLPDEEDELELELDLDDSLSLLLLLALEDPPSSSDTSTMGFLR